MDLSKPDIQMRISTREKLILTGLYLSKYDAAGLQELGFGTFHEAFNVIGYALNSKPASIKNYRDEFDPLFPNGRKGWHKRKIRNYCLSVLGEYQYFSFEAFTGLVLSFFDYSQKMEVGLALPSGDTSTFAQRLITGLAAERYFEAVHKGLPEFSAYKIENTTRFGCGYDFRLHGTAGTDNYLAVEVKGLKGLSGAISMTPKEHEVASSMRDRFFLFVVRNFDVSPSHIFFRDPIAGPLRFNRTERVVTQVSWLSNI